MDPRQLRALWVQVSPILLVRGMAVSMLKSHREIWNSYALWSWSGKVLMW